jgi:ATP-dependent Clp protease ATP-binding subunit ClpC
VFERFTDRARRVLTFAQEEARLLNHSFIGTEHVLLGLLREGEGLGAVALRELGVSLEDARQQVEAVIGMAGSAPVGSPPFTPRAKKVLELALREALQMNHSYIGTEHILLGLVREGEGVAATVLVSLGADLGRVRQEVVKLMSGTSETTSAVTGVHEPGPSGEEAPRDPCCPRCRGTLGDVARLRRMIVPPEDPNGQPMATTVVYCMRCGTTLHMLEADGST